MVELQGLLEGRPSEQAIKGRSHESVTDDSCAVLDDEAGTAIIVETDVPDACAGLHDKQAIEMVE